MFGKRLLERFAREERALESREFVAPVVPAGLVCLRVSGLASRFRVRPARHSGWAVLAVDGPFVRVVRAAGLAERERYLARLPRFRLVLVERDGRTWFGARACSDARLDATRLYPVGLVVEGEPFDVVCARFDGAGFWFEESDAGRDPRTAAFLREQLGRGVDAKMLERPGLTPEERAAYGHALAAKDRRAAAARALTPEGRASTALAHAGARLVASSATADGLWVDFEIEGRTHRSLVRSVDLTVVSAGICLSGMDADFDLTSLVSVMRESGE